MESLRRKRKGSETNWDHASSDHRKIFHPSVIGPHLSLEDCSKRKKKCEDQRESEETVSHKSRLIGIVTAPPYGSSSSDPPGRGHKRKIGCIEAATQISRKKNLEQEYELGSELGQGKFGSVRLCRSRASGEEFACKSLLKVGEETVHREVEIMQHLSGHPSVVTLKAVYEDSDSFHLVMELCCGGRLLDDMVKEGKYGEHRAANVVKEVASVIKYCHDMGVVHRDVKPENILLTASGKVKLADFGLAVRVSNGQSLSGVAGSPAYVAPEVLGGNYSEKVDIWSAGVLLHALLVGVLPFQGDSLEAVFEAIKKVKLDFQSEIWESISKPARDLVSRMLTRDVSARITADEVLRHPWIVFNTERSLKTFSVKSKARSQGGSARPISFITGIELKRVREAKGALLDGSSSLSLESPSQQSEEEEDCVLVDALAAAISCVRISEPKRSRLCGPASPIQQECSSNMKANLCTAF